MQVFTCRELINYNELSVDVSRFSLFQEMTLI